MGLHLRMGFLADIIKMRPHWIGVDPKYNDWCPYRKRRGGWEREKTLCEDWGGDWRAAATIHGTARATRCWTVPWGLEAHANNLGFGLLASRTVREWILLVQATQFVIIC